MPHSLHSSYLLRHGRGCGLVTKAPSHAWVKVRPHFEASPSPVAARRHQICCQHGVGNIIFTNSENLCLFFCSLLAPLAIKVHPRDCAGSWTLFLCPTYINIYSFTPDFFPAFFFPFLLPTIYFWELITHLSTCDITFLQGSSCTPLYT